MSKLLPRLPRQSRRKDRTLYEHLFQDGRAFLVTDRVRVLVISLAVSTIFIKGARLQSLCGVSFSSRDQRRDHLRS
jgi:hypothetical protein